MPSHETERKRCYEDRSRKMKIPPRLFLIGLLAVIAIIFVVLPAIQQEEIKREDIDQVLQQGDLKQSLLKIDQYLKSHPNDPEIILLKGKLLLESAPAQSMELLGKATEFPTTQESAQRVLAAVAMSKADYSTAEIYLHDLLEHSPDDEALLFSMAESLFHQKKFSAALSIIRVAIQKQPNRAESYLLMAEVLDELGRVIESVEPLKQALRISPENPVVHANLSYALFFSGDIKEARKHLSIALKKSPHNIALLVIKAKIQKEDGDVPSAVGTLRAILKASPQHEESRLLLAELYMFQNEPQAALELLEEIDGTKKTGHRTLILLSRAAWMAGETEKAKTYQAQIKLNLNKRN